MSSSDKLIVALDVSNLKEAEKLVKTLSPWVKIFKVGKELFTAAGPQAVQMVNASGSRVFLDLKFHDIPNTVAAACRTATNLGVFMLNVHACGGKNMLVAARNAVSEASKEQKINSPILLAVTVLTSLSDSDLHEVGVSKNVTTQVQDLACLAKNCGLSGVVASGQEIEIVKKAAGNDFLAVTPGVRPVWAAAQDQKRILTPYDAIKKGADFIVVGRPITGDKEPATAVQRILDEINK